MRCYYFLTFSPAASVLMFLSALSLKSIRKTGLHWACLVCKLLIILTGSANDQSASKEIMQALRDSDLDLSPTLSGQVILVPVPRYVSFVLTEISALQKSLRKSWCPLLPRALKRYFLPSLFLTLQARIAIRGIRQKLMTEIKDSKLPKDEDRKAQEKAQALHDKYVQSLDKLLKDKQQQLRK